MEASARARQGVEAPAFTLVIGMVPGERPDSAAAGWSRRMIGIDARQK